MSDGRSGAGRRRGRRLAPRRSDRPADRNRVRPGGRCRATSTRCARIFALKGRPADHPLIVHVAGAEQLGEFGRDGRRRGDALARAFWPGPLTLILPRSARVPDVVTGGQDSVGLRCPAHPLALASAARVRRRPRRAFGESLRPHQPDLGRARARRNSAPAVPIVLDGGDCEVGIESTIVDLSSHDAAHPAAGPHHRANNSRR